MATYDRDALQAQLIIDEGLRLKIYRDSMGIESIGVGRNLVAVGISKPEAMFLLGNDIAAAEQALDYNAPWWRGLDPVRQAVLVNMCFNMGWAKLSGFKNTLALIQSGSYGPASQAMLASAWAAQVGARAQRLSAQMAAGTIIEG